MNEIRDKVKSRFLNHFLPSTFTLQLDELGDEYEDSAELMASISASTKRHKTA